MLLFDLHRVRQAYLINGFAWTPGKSALIYLCLKHHKSLLAFDFTSVSLGVKMLSFVCLVVILATNYFGSIAYQSSRCLLTLYSQETFWEVCICWLIIFYRWWAWRSWVCCVWYHFLFISLILAIVISLWLLKIHILLQTILWKRPKDSRSLSFCESWSPKLIYFIIIIKLYVICASC